jgi:hypothetical protein
MKLWTATYLLMGFHYPDERATGLLQREKIMRESTTCQKVLRGIGTIEYSTAECSTGTTCSLS